MLEDKYIGLALAVSSSLAIGTSFIITKKVGGTHFPMLFVVLNSISCRALMTLLNAMHMEHKPRTIMHT
jgi:hypothetical protein